MMEVEKITLIRFTPLQNEIPLNSRWYWFNHRHPKLNTCFSKGLEGFTNLCYHSFYPNLQVVYI
jgi:hypothetical protein